MSDARYAAYHEAGHAVAAAVLGFPFRSSGIHIDDDGKGATQIVKASRRLSSPFSDLQSRQAQMVILLSAGLVAQKRFCPDSPDKSASDDNEKIKQYLGAIYRTQEASKLVARNYLEQEAERLVDTFCGAIGQLAERVWRKEFTTRTEDWGSALTLEKTVGASEIGEVFREWNISCSIDDYAVEEELTTIAD